MEDIDMYDLSQLTIRISLEKRVQNLEMTGDLLASSPLASQLKDVFSNKLVPAI
jgi:hypothetical protein